jgi:hypothetical protein
VADDSQELGKLRDQIDAIDGELLRLINVRIRRAQAFRRRAERCRPAPASTMCSARSSRAMLHYGVVPIENSTEGAIGRSLDLLLSSPCRSAARSTCRSITS